MGRRRPGRVPHPRGRLDRPGPAAAGALPGRVPGGLPVYQTRHCGDRPAVRRRRHRRGRARVHPGQPGARVVRRRLHRARRAGRPATARRPLRAIGVAEVIAPRQHAATPDRDGRLRRPQCASCWPAPQGVTATCSRPDGPRYGAIDLDSNLPDFRIALGGPDENPFTAEVLAAAGPAAAAALDRQLARGRDGAVWVPADAQPRRRVRAGRRPARRADLPVLIVAGRGPGRPGRRDREPVIEDLADAVIEVDRAAAGGAPGGGTARRWPGTRSRCSTGARPAAWSRPDGTLHIALMRACSAWPCGVWIDGEQRTAPDGSSFAWQHWSHTFEYALAAGPGDWRSAGFPAGRAGLQPRPAGLPDRRCTPARCRRGQPGQRRAARRPAVRAEAARQPARPRPRPAPARRTGSTVRLRDIGRAGRRRRGAPGGPVHRRWPRPA